MSRHSCPGGCGAEVPNDRLACHQDWFRLPKPLRQAVNKAWREREQHPAAHDEAVRTASRWYRDNPREAGRG